MNDKVQDKIKHILSLAKTSVKENGDIPAGLFRSNEDSLSKAIRTPEDATVFMAELDAIIKVSSQAK